jgi:hypothetical protein
MTNPLAKSVTPLNEKILLVGLFHGFQLERARFILFNKFEKEIYFTILEVYC